MSKVTDYITKEKIEKSSPEEEVEELEKELAKVEIIPKAFIKESLFEELKTIFGKDVEILVTS